MSRTETVAILGASPKAERYSNMAQRLLVEKGYRVVLVNPSCESILGLPCYASLSEYAGSVDTVTLYLGPNRIGAVLESIAVKKPRRVIFNPGTEDEAAVSYFQERGIEIVEACSLVMLRLGQF